MTGAAAPTRQRARARVESPASARPEPAPATARPSATVVPEVGPARPADVRAPPDRRHARPGPVVHRPARERSPGRPFPPAVRASMAAAFGTDLDDVRLPERDPVSTAPLQLLRVSAPGDPLELEAARVARRVAAGQDPGPISSLRSAGPQAVGERDDDVGGDGGGSGEPVQPSAEGDPPVVSPAVVAAVGSPGPGVPIPPSVRSVVEPALGAGLGGVQVHAGARAQRAAGSLGARAFTHGNHIFLGREESADDLRLMAHEATHVVQQGAADVVGRQAGSSSGEIQRLPAFIANRLAEYARHIPGYTLFTVVVGFNPLTGARVERTAMTLVEGLMGLVPFGTAIFDKLVELGIIQDAFAFVERQLATFDLSLSRIERLLQEAWDEMSFVPRFGMFEENLGILVGKFSALLADVRGFAASLVDAIVQLIKDAAIGVAEELLRDNRAWALIRKVLGHDPLRDEPVDATIVEILEDFLLLIGKDQELEQMRARGTLQATAEWIESQLATFRALLDQLRGLFDAAWDAIRPENLPNLGSNLQALATRAAGLLQGIWDFAGTVAAKVLELIKDALLGWLSEFAHEAPGFHLLTVILGRNPFTGERVPRTAENLIKGFITLLPGGNAAYAELAKTGVVGKAAATIEGAMSELGISWDMVTGLFRSIWDSLGIGDVAKPIETFTRIRDQFGEPIARLFAFIRVVVQEIFTLVLALMDFPSEVVGRIVANAMQAYEDIKRDVVAFFINMLAAVKAGFTRFFGNVFEYLLRGLVDWLFRGLRQAGITPPSQLTLETALDLVVQVLGITTDRLWAKLAERIGRERVDQIRGAMDRLEGIWNFLRDVQERGVAGVWVYIEGQITNLWDTIIEQARAWIMETIVDRVMRRIVSMLDPTGIMAVVNSFIAFFDAVQAAVEYIRELLDIVDQYVATLAAVARGDTEPGAARLEQGLASAVPVAIGFLAYQVGLGNVGDKIAEILAGLRALVDRALDWLLDQAERMLAALLRTLGLAGPEGEAEAAPVDVGDHVAFARHAANLLKEAPLRSDGNALDAARSFAASREPTLSAQLGTGVSLRYVFPDEATSAAGHLLVFRVVIAPNTTSHEDELELPPDPRYPRRSAPGVGDTGHHGDKPSSLREGERIWWLESEHILPFATGRSLWQALSLYLPERGWPEDKKQTTIMIYERAARIKTPEDNTVSTIFDNAVDTLRIPQKMELAVNRYQLGDTQALEEGRDILSGLVSALRKAQREAVERTNRAISEENRETESGYDEDNGQRRAVPPAREADTPAPGLVASAAEEQYEDLLDLVTAEMLSRNELERKVDRILGRR